MKAPAHVTLRQAFIGLVSTVAILHLATFTRAQSATEYQVKSAFLYNFARFVEWPPAPGGRSAGPIVICVVGADPFEGALDSIVKGKTANGRSMEVRHVKRAEDARSCQIAFVGASEKSHIPAFLAALKDTDVVTVGETEDFARGGGMINFVLEGDRVHLEVNIDAADRAKVKISSKLLSLAKIIRENPRR